MKKILLLFVSASFAAAAPAQIVSDSSGWSLEQCIAYAQEHNLPVQQQALDEQSAKADLRQSRGNFLPSVNGYASHTYQYGLTVDRFTNTFANSQVVSQNLYLAGSLTLFSGLQNLNQLAQSRYQLEAGRMQTQQVKNDLALAVAAAYLNLLFADEQAGIARRQAEVTQVQVKRTKVLADAGAVAQGALFDLKAQLAQENAVAVAAQNNLELAQLALAQLMNLDSTAGFTIRRPQTDMNGSLALNAEQVYREALLNQPAIKKAEFDLRSAQKGVAVAWGALSPSVALVGSIGTGYSGAAKTLQSTSYSGEDTIGYTTAGAYVLSPAYDYTYVTTPYAQQFSNNLNRSFGVQVSVPIFNRLQTSSSITRAKIEREKAELAIELQEQELKKRIDQAQADAKAALEKLQAQQQALEAAETAFGYAEEKFNAGSGNVYDYANAKNRFAAAQSNFLQAKYDHYFRLKMLEHYQGKPLR